MATRSSARSRTCTTRSARPCRRAAASRSPDTLADRAAEITATGLFTDVTIRRFDWEITYTADSYLRLLDTFSGHIAMASWQRERLYGEIRRRLGQRPDGRVRRHWGAVLHVARAKPRPDRGPVP